MIPPTIFMAPNNEGFLTVADVLRNTGSIRYGRRKIDILQTKGDVFYIENKDFLFYLREYEGNLELRRNNFSVTLS